MSLRFTLRYEILMDHENHLSHESQHYFVIWIKFVSRDYRKCCEICYSDDIIATDLWHELIIIEFYSKSIDSFSQSIYEYKL